MAVAAVTVDETGPEVASATVAETVRPCYPSSTTGGVVQVTVGETVSTEKLACAEAVLP